METKTQHKLLMPPDLAEKELPRLATAASDRHAINNSFYDTLGDRWVHADDDPVALLRAEGELKNPWVAERIRANLGLGPARVLDIGCGAGFLANYLTGIGHRVSGIDMSLGSLKVAQMQSVSAMQSALAITNIPPKPARYRVADAYRLPFRAGTLDVVTALDFLEHVSEPDRVIAEASRVLKPGGLFFYHTFNRNRIAWLVVIKGLEWFVKNTPDHMHVLPLFIKPSELACYCEKAGMQVEQVVGIRPVVESLAFWKMLATRKVPRDFRFRFTPSLMISYLGFARKTRGL